MLATEKRLIMCSNPAHEGLVISEVNVIVLCPPVFKLSAGPGDVFPASGSEVPGAVSVETNMAIQLIGTL